MITLSNAQHVLYGCSLANQIIDWKTRPHGAADPKGYLEIFFRCVQMELLTQVAGPLVQHLTGSPLSFRAKTFICLSPALAYWIRNKIENEQDVREYIPAFFITGLYKINANFDLLIREAFILIGIGEILLRPRIYVATTVTLIVAGCGVKFGYISEQVNHLYLQTIPWTASALLLLSKDYLRKIEGAISLYQNIRVYQPKHVLRLEKYLKSFIPEELADLPLTPEALERQLEELKALENNEFQNTQPPGRKREGEKVKGSAFETTLSLEKLVSSIIERENKK